MKSKLQKIIFSLLSLFLITFPLLAETPTQVDFLIAGLRDSSGQPLEAGKIYTYACGTTTNKDTWTDAGRSILWSNPIELDGEGKALVFADGCYKFKINDQNDTTLYTLDGLKFGLYGGGSSYAGPTTGAANAYVATLSPALVDVTGGEPPNGTVITFEANHTNTGAATLNVNGTGAEQLNRSNDTPLTAGEIVSGNTYSAVYEESTTAWLLLSPTFVSGTFTSVLTNTTNVAVSAAYAGLYTRISDRVTYNFAVDIDPTATGTPTELRLSIPVASTFSVFTDALGVCHTTSIFGLGSAIFAQVGGGLRLSFISDGAAASQTHYCTVTYRVI